MAEAAVYLRELIKSERSQRNIKENSTLFAFCVVSGMMMQSKNSLAPPATFYRIMDDYDENSIKHDFLACSGALMAASMEVILDLTQQLAASELARKNLEALIVNGEPK